MCPLSRTAEGLSSPDLLLCKRVTDVDADALTRTLMTATPPLSFASRSCSFSLQHVPARMSGTTV